MPLVITWIFTLVVGTLIFQAVRSRFFVGTRFTSIPLILTTALIYIGTYYVGILVGSLVWGTTVIALRLVLILAALAFIIFGSYWIYLKLTGKQKRNIKPHINPTTGDPVQEAEIIEIIDNDRSQKN